MTIEVGDPVVSTSLAAAFGMTAMGAGLLPISVGYLIAHYLRTIKDLHFPSPNFVVFFELLFIIT